MSDAARMDWPQLREAVSQCRACGLCETRTHTVSGTGDERAGWMFVGEAPGAEEDRLGEPFVGNAVACSTRCSPRWGWRAGTTYHRQRARRPPQNRDPSPDEMQRCEPYLRRQIEPVAPRVIVVVGRIAAQSCCAPRLRSPACADARPRLPDRRARGSGRRATIHPAYPLRSPQDKARAWADLVLAPRARRRRRPSACSPDQRPSRTRAGWLGAAGSRRASSTRRRRRRPRSRRSRRARGAATASRARASAGCSGSR